MCLECAIFNGPYQTDNAGAHSLCPKAGNKAYAWSVVPDHTALGVCLERMHRIFSELLVLAQRYNPVETGPCRVSLNLNYRLKQGHQQGHQLAALQKREFFIRFVGPRVTTWFGYDPRHPRSPPHSCA